MSKKPFLLCGAIIGLSIFLSQCQSSNRKQSQVKFPLYPNSFKVQKVYEPLKGLKIHSYVHPNNGLKVLLSPRPGSGAISYVQAFDVGSRNEKKGRTGLAHLFEHMMFRGTESFPNPHKTMSKWGGRSNAYTSLDITLYYEQVPAPLTEKVIKFESERMQKLFITPNVFKLEKGAVVSERKRGIEDNAWGRLNWELYQNHFDTHPYKTNPIGWQSDLDKSTYDDAIHFYKKHYAPNNAVIAVVGDFELKTMLGLLDKYYAPLKRSNLKKDQISRDRRKAKFRRRVYNVVTENVIFADARDGLVFSDRRVPSEVLLCFLLTNSGTGYLYNELVQKSKVQSINAGCYPDKDPGMSSLYVSGMPGKSVKETEKTYLNALKAFPSWLKDSDIERAKLYFLSANWSSLRDPNDLAEGLAEYTIKANNPMYFFNLTEKVQKVTRADILARWNEWSKRKQTRVLINPSKKSDPLKKR